MMLQFKYLLIILATMSILASLPTTTQCDTSYYEKYYSARRFQVPRQPILVYLNFTVNLSNERYQLEEFETIGMVGDVKALGHWRPNRAVMLNRSKEFGKWEISLQLPVNTIINYRYFIGVIDKDSDTIQIRRWEANVQSRYINVATININITDQFGVINGAKGNIIRNGWLCSGYLIQFKLFRQPLKILDVKLHHEDKQQLRIKLQAIDPEWRTPIMPSGRAYIEYVHLEYGNSFLSWQNEFGVHYKNDSIIIFQVRVGILKKIAYLFQVYVENTFEKLVRLIGYQYIYPENLMNTDGKIQLHLLSPAWLNTMGYLDITYVVIKPLSNNTLVDFRTSFAEYWHDKWFGLEVGHRGLGKSLKESATLAAPAIENTLGSLITSANLGADLVEFDVQLTKDLIPIIYHDFFIRVCIVSKTPTNPEDLTEVLIKDITYEQLKDLKTYQVVGTKIIEYPSHNSITDDKQRLFPSLEDVLTKVNKTLGFNIEIKWPQLRQDNTWESIQTIDKNLYIDRILEIVLKYGCGRFSFFSSFDADICSMLRYKQNMYPVMFIMPSKESYYVDPRSNTIYNTVNTAQAFDFMGIVPNAVYIKSNPSWIQLALQQHKKVFIWGADLKNRKAIDWYLNQEPTGVIYDRLDLHLPPNRTNILQMDANAIQLLQKQCSTQKNHEDHGSLINKTTFDIFNNTNNSNLL